MRGAGVRTAPSLVTQFAVPPPPFGMVDRPRLSERLQSGLAEPVTLVCAPAGSGKTALVASQVPEAAWITLERADDEPARLWGAVMTALEHVTPPDSALAGLAAPLRETNDAFIPLLVNALAELPERVILVLDDVHVLKSRECLTQLAFLLLHMPHRADGGIRQAHDLAAALRRSGSTARVEMVDAPRETGHHELNLRMGEPGFGATTAVDAWLAELFGREAP